MSTTTEAPASAARVRLISPVLIAMLAVIALGGWQLWVENATLVVELGPAAIASIFAWIAYGFIVVGIVLVLQRFAKRPAWGIVLALAWGGLAATWIAEQGNGAMSTIFLRTFNMDPHQWLSTPVIEESMKALGVLGLLLIPILRRFRALDGLLYGVLIGAGFQVVEDAVYTISALLHDPANAMGSIVGMIVLRGFTVGLFTHAVYTGVVGAAIGWAASAPAGHKVRRGFAAAGALALMMVAHGAFNSQDDLSPVAIAASFVPLAMLLLVIWWARRGEVAHLATVAADNGGWGVLGTEDIATIPGKRPATRDARRARDRVLRFAWSADHLGPDTPQARRAAAAIVPAAPEAH